MRHSADLGGVSCSLYLLVESVRVPGQPLQPQCSVYTSLLIRSHLLSQENQHNHHKCIEGLLFHVDFQLRAVICSLVYSSKELCRITYNYSITLSKASIELCMYVLGYIQWAMLCGGVGDLEFVHLLHLDNLLFEMVWAHPQSLQHLGSCLHQLQEHVQLAVCVCVCVSE